MRVYILLLSSVLIFSYFLTYIIRIISIRKNILDIPNNRSSHSVPTPRGGGLAIVLSWYFGLIFLFIKKEIDPDLFMALLPGVLLAIISLTDDIVRLNPGTRLIVQLVTASMSLVFLKGIEPVILFNNIVIPKIIIIPIALIASIWFINLYNFLDGIDGYASIEAICVLAGLYIFTGDILNLLLIASVLGFLIWNWPKAKIFMGDVGSTQLGFIMIILCFWYHNSQKVPVIIWIILTCPFWFDATYTLFRRWRNNEELSEAHRKHIYQRLVQSGFSHLQVDYFLCLINTLLIALAYFSTTNIWMQVIVLIGSMIIMYLIAIFTDKRIPFPRENHNRT